MACLEQLAIRRCRATDLDMLEWDGAFSHDRDIIDETFARMREGTMAMLVAEVAGAHAGQVWLDFARWYDRAVVWALRVKPQWQNRGIGSRLLAAAERTSARRGLAAVEIEVEPGSPARCLYERCGYVYLRSDPTFDVLCKSLVGGSGALTSDARLV